MRRRVEESFFADTFFRNTRFALLKRAAACSKYIGSPQSSISLMLCTSLNRGCGWRK